MSFHIHPFRFRATFNRFSRFNDGKCSHFPSSYFLHIFISHNVITETLENSKRYVAVQKVCASADAEYTCVGYVSTLAFIPANI